MFPAPGARGFSLAVVLVVLALVMVGIIAALGLSRLGRSNADAATSTTRLSVAADALEQFAGAAHRLPCPANPATDTGLEEPTAPGSATCVYTQGTVPWRTIGLRRDDSYDAWGFKISYRVYTGNGSLVQPEGVNMTECDLVDPAPAGTTGTGLCVANAEPYLRATVAETFFKFGGVGVNDRGMPLTDNGAARNAAYVLVSHGSTALGAYTVAGTRREMPVGAERSNTLDAGPFTIQAFSEADTPASQATHFDDLLVYRTLRDLVPRIGLAARDWPEGGKASSVFTNMGLTGSGNLGISAFTAQGVTYSSFLSGAASNFSYATVGGLQGLGGAGGASLALSKDEFIRMDLGSVDYARIAITFNNFGFDAAAVPKDREQVELRFYASGVAVGVPVKRQACQVDGGFATVMVEPTVPGAKFDRVEIQPLAFSQSPTVSTLLYISELAACGPTAACSTSVESASNTCAIPTLASTAFSPASVAVNVASTWSLSLANGTDNAANGGIAFTYTLPPGLVFTTLPSGCSGTLTLAIGAKSFSATGVGIADGSAACTISAAVASPTEGTFADRPASLTSLANVGNALSGGTLTVVAP